MRAGKPKFRSWLANSLAATALLYSTTSVAAPVTTSPKASETLKAVWKNADAKTVPPKKYVKQHLKKSKPAKTKYTRAQYHKRFKLEQKLKLDRQRAAWRAKWEAEQKARQKGRSLAIPTRTVSARINNQQTQPGEKYNNRNLLAAASHKLRQQAAKKPQQKLTRAQYHEHFRQQQNKATLAKDRLRIQKTSLAIAKTTKKTRIKATKTATKETARQERKAVPQPRYAKFRPLNKKAVLRSLPFDVKHTLRSARLSEYGLSAYVQEVNSNRPLLAYKDASSRVPASVMKLITSYAALGILGPDYRWPLKVYTKGVVKNGVLRGDLIIKGYGSPEFNSPELRKLLRGIRHKGIQSVDGRLVFDNSYFSIPRQSAGAFDGKVFASYNAQPDALLYNERISSFQVHTSGRHVKVSTSTPAHNLKIVNRMRKVRRGCRPRIGISHRGAKVIATFKGTFSKRCGTRTYSRVISKPADMIYGAMKTEWKRVVGGTLNARFAMGKAPANARPLLTLYSRTLAEILPTIDKESNNVMARQLLLTIGAKHSGTQGTPEKGANAIGVWLNSRGLHFPELRIENGSGLSRLARISARHVGDLLVDAYKSPYRNYLMRSLAVAGVDGTMKRRLRGTPVRGRGYFKTGTLKNVRSIAGYVKAANGKTYVVSILHNDPKARRRGGRAAHDKLIEWVFNSALNNTQVAMR